MSKNENKSLNYGILGQKNCNHEEKQPFYEKARSTRSTAQTIAVVGLFSIQLILIVSVLNQLYSERYTRNIVPEQLHLSLGKNDNEYYVSWATPQIASCHLVWSKQGSLVSKSVPGHMKEAFYEDVQEEDMKKLFDNTLLIGENTFEKYFYHAKMTGISPGFTYYYHVACEQFRYDDYVAGKKTIYLSERYHFNAVSLDDVSKPVKFIFFGDLGLNNAQSVPRLIEEALSYKNDFIIHNGDFAYDLDTDRGRYGDEFMKLMEPIAARIPYQTSVGNHEIKRNFTHYDKRFNMINRGPINNGQANNFFYSFDAGPIHFIAISTEFYYFLDYVGIAPLMYQYEWLKADLAAASSVAGRTKRPWIIVYGHRPMYCSSRDNDDCSKETNILRHGLPFTHTFALEKLFYDYGVDVELYSHEHQYERFLPIYNGKVYNGTDKAHDPYFNPLGPVHLISGSAGCQEKLDPFVGHPVTGSVKQIVDYGYTKIQASRCRLHLEQVSDDQAGLVVDEFTISKNKQNFPPEKSSLHYEC